MRQYALVISNHLNYTTKNGTQHNIYIYFAVGISISNIIYIHKIHYVLEEKLMGKKNIKWHHSCTATKHFNDSLYQVHCIELVRPKIARVFFSALRLTKLENFLKAIFDLSKREREKKHSFDWQNSIDSFFVYSSFFCVEFPFSAILNESPDGLHHFPNITWAGRVDNSYDLWWHFT